MGHIKYGTELIDFSDILLSHIQMAVSTKLRRGENFFLTWSVPAFMGSGRHSIWIDNSVPIQFVYARRVRASMDMAWMEKVLAAAATPGGLHLPDEEPFAWEQIETPATSAAPPSSGD